MRARRPAARVLLAATLFAGACAGGESDAAPEPSTSVAPNEPASGAQAPFLALVDPDGAEAILASGAVTVIDVRTPAEFADGHLPGAELIDISASDFVSRISALDRSATYFVYCRSANRSGQATALMADLGFESIYELEGGTVGWEASGRALATG